MLCHFIGYSPIFSKHSFKLGISNLPNSFSVCVLSLLLDSFSSLMSDFSESEHLALVVTSISIGSGWLVSSLILHPGQIFPLTKIFFYLFSKVSCTLNQTRNLKMLKCVLSSSQYVFKVLFNSIKKSSKMIKIFCFPGG